CSWLRGGSLLIGEESCLQLRSKISRTRLLQATARLRLCFMLNGSGAPCLSSIRVVTTHGAMDWFQQGVWLVYGRVGGLLLLLLVPETWAGIGLLQLFAPLVRLVIYSFVLAVVFRMLRRSGES